MTLTREQIESWRAEFNRDPDDMYSPGAIQELRALCDLALAGLAVQPRPIEEAPKDGTWLLFFGRNSTRQRMIPVVIAWSPPGLGEGWRDSAGGASMDSLVATGGDFIPLSALPKPEAKP
jgi:hypothetical protein